MHHDGRAVKVSTHLFRLKDVEGLTRGAADVAGCKLDAFGGNGSFDAQRIEGGQGIRP